MGEAAVPLRKPSQRHSTLRGIDAHHVLCALNPNASHLRATAASLAECTQLQRITASLLQTEPETGRTECVSVSGAPADGNRPAGMEESGRVEHADGSRPATLEERGSGRAPQPHIHRYTHATATVHTRNCHGFIQKFQTLQGATNRSLKKKNPNRQRHSHTLDAECSDPALYV